MEFDVFEMYYTKKEVQEAGISCTPIKRQALRR